VEGGQKTWTVACVIVEVAIGEDFKKRLDKGGSDSAPIFFFLLPLQHLPRLLKGCPERIWPDMLRE